MLVDRYVRDRIDVAEFYHLIGKELQGPSSSALRRIAAGENRELCVDIAGDRRFAPGSRFVVKTAFQPFGQKLNACPLNIAVACTERCDDLNIRETIRAIPIRKQQDSGLGLGSGQGCSGLDERGQGCPLIDCEINSM